MNLYEYISQREKEEQEQREATTGKGFDLYSYISQREKEEEQKEQLIRLTPPERGTPEIRLPIEKTPEQLATDQRRGFTEDEIIPQTTGVGVLDQLISGASNVAKNFYRMPGAILNIAAETGKFLTGFAPYAPKAPGIIDERAFTDVLKEDYDIDLMNNKLTKSAEYAEIAYNRVQDKYAGEDIFSVVKNKGAAEIGEYVGLNLLNMAPYTLGLMLAWTAKLPQALNFTLMASMRAGEAIEENIRKKIPAVKAIADGTLKGLAEAGFEQFFPVMRKWSEAIAGAAVQPAKEIARAVGKTLAASFIQEGAVEEGGTELADALSEYIVLGNKDAFKGIAGRIAEQSIIGGLGGLAFTAPAGVVAGVGAYDKQVQTERLNTLTRQLGAYEKQKGEEAAAYETAQREEEAEVKAEEARPFKTVDRMAELREEAAKEPEAGLTPGKQRILDWAAIDAKPEVTRTAEEKLFMEEFEEEATRKAAPKKAAVKAEAEKPVEIGVSLSGWIAASGKTPALQTFEDRAIIREAEKLKFLPIDTDARNVLKAGDTIRDGKKDVWVITKAKKNIFSLQKQTDASDVMTKTFDSLAGRGWSYDITAKKAVPETVPGAGEEEAKAKKGRLIIPKVAPAAKAEPAPTIPEETIVVEKPKPIKTVQPDITEMLEKPKRAEQPEKPAKTEIPALPPAPTEKVAGMFEQGTKAGIVEGGGTQKETIFAQLRDYTGLKKSVNIKKYKDSRAEVFTKDALMDKTRALFGETQYFGKLSPNQKIDVMEAVEKEYKPSETKPVPAGEALTVEEVKLRGEVRGAVSRADRGADKLIGKLKNIKTKARLKIVNRLRDELGLSAKYSTAVQEELMAQFGLSGKEADFNKLYGEKLQEHATLIEKMIESPELTKKFKEKVIKRAKFKLEGAKQGVEREELGESIPKIVKNALESAQTPEELVAAVTLKGKVSLTLEEAGTLLTVRNYERYVANRRKAEVGRKLALPEITAEAIETGIAGEAEKPAIDALNKLGYTKGEIASINKKLGAEHAAKFLNKAIAEKSKNTLGKDADVEKIKKALDKKKPEGGGLAGIRMRDYNIIRKELFERISAQMGNDSEAAEALLSAFDLHESRGGKDPTADLIFLRLQEGQLISRRGKEFALQYVGDLLARRRTGRSMTSMEDLLGPMSALTDAEKSEFKKEIESKIKGGMTILEDFSTEKPPTTPEGGELVLYDIGAVMGEDAYKALDSYVKSRTGLDTKELFNYGLAKFMEGYNNLRDWTKQMVKKFGAGFKAIALKVWQAVKGEGGGLDMDALRKGLREKAAAITSRLEKATEAVGKPEEGAAEAEQVQAEETEADTKKSAGKSMTYYLTQYGENEDWKKDKKALEATHKYAAGVLKLDKDSIAQTLEKGGTLKDVFNALSEIYIKNAPTFKKGKLKETMDALEGKRVLLDKFYELLEKDKLSNGLINQLRDFGNILTRGWGNAGSQLYAGMAMGIRARAVMEQSTLPELLRFKIHVFGKDYKIINQNATTEKFIEALMNRDRMTELMEGVDKASRLYFSNIVKKLDEIKDWLDEHGIKTEENYYPYIFKNVLETMQGAAEFKNGVMETGLGGFDSMFDIVTKDVFKAAERGIEGKRGLAVRTQFILPRKTDIEAGDIRRDFFNVIHRYFKGMYKYMAFYPMLDKKNGYLYTGFLNDMPPVKFKSGFLRHDFDVFIKNWIDDIMNSEGIEYGIGDKFMILLYNTRLWNPLATSALNFMQPMYGWLRNNSLGRAYGGKLLRDYNASVLGEATVMRNIADSRQLLEYQVMKELIENVEGAGRKGWFNSYINLLKKSNVWIKTERHAWDKMIFASVAAWAMEQDEYKRKPEYDTIVDIVREYFKHNNIHDGNETSKQIWKKIMSIAATVLVDAQKSGQPVAWRRLSSNILFRYLRMWKRFPLANTEYILDSFGDAGIITDATRVYDITKEEADNYYNMFLLKRVLKQMRSLYKNTEYGKTVKNLVKQNKRDIKAAVGQIIKERGLPSRIKGRGLAYAKITAVNLGVTTFVSLLEIFMRSLWDEDYEAEDDLPLLMTRMFAALMPSASNWLLYPSSAMRLGVDILEVGGYGGPISTYKKMSKKVVKLFWDSGPGIFDKLLTQGKMFNKAWDALTES